MLLWGSIEDAQRDITGFGRPAWSEHRVHEILAWLWDCVTEPVLNQLGFNGAPPGKTPMAGRLLVSIAFLDVSAPARGGSSPDALRRRSGLGDG